MKPLLRPRGPTEDHPLLRWTLTLIALAFIGLFLVLPLVNVFDGALSEGWKTARAAIEDSDTPLRHPPDADRGRDRSAAQRAVRHCRVLGDRQVRFHR